MLRVFLGIQVTHCQKFFFIPSSLIISQMPANERSETVICRSRPAIVTFTGTLDLWNVRKYRGVCSIDWRIYRHLLFTVVPTGEVEYVLFSTSAIAWHLLLPCRIVSIVTMTIDIARQLISHMTQTFSGGKCVGMGTATNIYHQQQVECLVPFYNLWIYCLDH